MKNKTSCKSGFTLIELLVVVLIIGILASIALPQYQKAVDKAHAMEAVVQGRALQNALLLYYQNTGNTYTEDFEVLDWTLPDNLQWFWSGNHYETAALKSGSRFEVALWGGGNSYGLFCKVGANNKRGDKVCKQLGSFSHSNSGGTNYYLIHRAYLH